MPPTAPEPGQKEHMCHSSKRKELSAMGASVTKIRRHVPIKKYSRYVIPELFGAVPQARALEGREWGVGECARGRVAVPPAPAG